MKADIHEVKEPEAVEPEEEEPEHKHGIGLGRYHKNMEPGIYRSNDSGVALFSSKHKILSESGFPSFTRPIEGAPIKVEMVNYRGDVRTYVTCAE